VIEVETPGRHDRTRVAIDCQVDGTVAHERLHLADLSHGGGFAAGTADVQRGERIIVTFVLDGCEVWCPARVAHVQPTRGFGFAFLEDELPDTTRAALERYLRRDE